VAVKVESHKSVGSMLLAIGAVVVLILLFDDYDNFVFPVYYAVSLVILVPFFWLYSKQSGPLLALAYLLALGMLGTMLWFVGRHLGWHLPLPRKLRPFG
jgi:hypothetical protein